MALLRCDFFSEVLGRGTSMTVVLPQPAAGQIGMGGSGGDGDPPVLYLLHGLSDDDTTWSRRTSVERYAAPHGLAVVMPQVGRSFYADEVHGGRYWTFLSEELPAVVARFFRVSQRREDTFVAGLSMGGYGAFKWALRQPERFAAAVSLSGVLDLGRHRGVPDDLRRVFGGSRVRGTGDDLLHLLGRTDPARLPRLMQHCGTEDFLYRENVVFRDAAAAAGVPLTTVFGPGDHEWGYWDAAIRQALPWLLPPS